MGKKKTKKAQKSGGATATQASEEKKKTEESIEEIERGDDLFISEADVNSITNFIRTTNKSFQSLGNLLVETFTGRCVVGLCHALLALYEESSEARDEVIRRLNIIYMVYRLPEIEVELRVKPTKTIADIHNHMFASFLFYVEESELELEAILARVIVTNGVSSIEKLTAPDFMHKALSMRDLKADREAFKQWEADNTAHWPKTLNDDIPLTSMMRHMGSDRQDYEAAITEAFYPLHHTTPTLIPPCLTIHRDEAGVMDDLSYPVLSDNEKYMKKIAEEGVYSANCADNQSKLLEALKLYENDVSTFQDALLRKLAPEDVTKATEEVFCPNPLVPSSSESGASTMSIEDEFSPFSVAEIVDENNMNVNKIQVYGHAVTLAVDAIIDGYPLSSSNTKMMILFVTKVSDKSPEFIKLYNASLRDDTLRVMLRVSMKIIVPFMIRVLKIEDVKTLERYMHILTEMEVAAHGMEIACKFADSLKKAGLINDETRKPIEWYMRTCMNNPSYVDNRRNCRLLAMLSAKLLNEKIIVGDDTIMELNAFTLKYTEHREATNLYSLSTKLRTASYRRLLEAEQDYPPNFFRSMDNY